MNKGKEITIALKFAEIDDQPYASEHKGWVSCLVAILNQTLEFYFQRSVSIQLKKETELIDEKEFEAFDAIIYILSPAFQLSSNIATEIAAIEKAVLFNTDYLNSKIHKVLKGPVEIKDLPVTISMGTFHYFYQTGNSGDSAYETLFDWDNSVAVRHKYWESFTNLLFDLLKNLKHSKHERFIPPKEQTIFLGASDVGQLWNRTNLLGELISRGVKVLPDHDHSIEVKHLNEPTKFYLKKSDFAIHFPEEFLPLGKNKIKGLEDLSYLKRYIWFNPEAEKELEKKKQYDELKQKLKNLDHVEAISSGIEDLKEIIFATRLRQESEEADSEGKDQPALYLIISEHFPEELKAGLLRILSTFNIRLLLLDKENVQEKRATHYQYLQKSAFCLICYDGKNPDWVRANVNEVMKSAGFNPGKSQQIKLGLVVENQISEDELQEYPHALSIISALSPSLEDDLNNYINGK